MNIDDLCDEYVTLLDWIEDMIYEGIREQEDEEFIELDRKIYSLLKTHSKSV